LDESLGKEDAIVKHKTLLYFMNIIDAIKANGDLGSSKRNAVWAYRSNWWNLFSRQ